MNKCSKCLKEKELSEFNWKNKAKKKKAVWCKKCHQKYKHQHYLNNKKYYKEKKIKYVKENNRRVNELKNKSCEDCHAKYPSFVMDFHHKNEKEKEDNISKMIKNGVSFEKILEEIKKCILVCANCHRLRTNGVLEERLNSSPLHGEDYRFESDTRY